MIGSPDDDGTTLTRYAFDVAPRALITGGAGGLGLGIARRIGSVGGTVVIADLPAALERLAPEDADAHELVAIDVTDEGSVSDAVAEATRRLGGLDTVVNAAGICRIGRFDDVSLDEWQETLAINLTGTFLVMREAMPFLRDSGRGRIVNLSSNAGKRGYPTLAAYCTSKFGIIGLTQAVATEVAPDGIRVNAVCPAMIPATPMGAEVVAQRLALGQAADPAELEAKRLADLPLGRTGTIEDVTEAVMFLLSDGAGWITGESLNIDGGSLAG